jgi:hypothetical protein
LPTVLLVIEGHWGMSYRDLLSLSLGGFVLFGLGALPAGWLGDQWSAGYHPRPSTCSSTPRFRMRHYGTLLRGRASSFMPGLPPPSKRAFLIGSCESPRRWPRHFSEAQQPDRAVGYWLAAGGRALRRSANREAIGHLSAGLALLAQLPDTADRAKRELALQRLLGQANFHVRGPAALETDRAFSRARKLSAAADDDQSIIPVLFGIILVEWGSA